MRDAQHGRDLVPNVSAAGAEGARAGAGAVLLLLFFVVLLCAGGARVVVVVVVSL